MGGVLYVVATPIGNLEDISARALRILQEADVVAAEDTRVTRKLLSHFGISTPLESYHRHSSGGREDRLIARLTSGQDVALVTDGGTPAISDPGGELVAAARRSGIAVVPIPGPSAISAALSAAGMRAQRYHFLGFPPRKHGERLRFFAPFAQDEETLVLYESPYRVTATLEAAYEALGDRRVVVCRELTKRFEEIVGGRLAEVVVQLRSKPAKGEFVIVIEGAV